jgi:hypothetical protein
MASWIRHPIRLGYPRSSSFPTAHSCDGEALPKISQYFQDLGVIAMEKLDFHGLQHQNNEL